MTAAVHLTQAWVERSGRRVIRSLDMTVPSGGWFGLIGANGSGKTSLLRAIAGRLTFAGGTCLVDGVDLAGDRQARARHFGFAPPADRLPAAGRASFTRPRQTTRQPTAATAAAPRYSVEKPHRAATTPPKNAPAAKPEPIAVETVP